MFGDFLKSVPLSHLEIPGYAAARLACNSIGTENFDNWDRQLKGQIIALVIASFMVTK